ncbi:MAG: helix-turn-helix transcriptional regulator, partial [Nonomuraea sp.]|nr:helix-turn-helix transcriptional regulator [Nonomuraea sp.]
EELETLAAGLGDAVLSAQTVKVMGTHAMMAGRSAQGLKLLGAAGRELAVLGEEELAALAAMDECHGLTASGDFPAARAAGERLLERVGEGEGYIRGSALAVIGCCLMFDGHDFGAAGERLREALRLRYALRDQFSFGIAVDMLAIHASRSGRWVRAASLCGVGQSIWRRFSAPLAGIAVIIAQRDRAAARARAELGEERYRAAFAHGASLSLEDAVRLADSDADTVVPRPPRADLAALSAREQEVASLIAEGLTNRQIAERLVISKRTADAHVEHILAKLGLSSRIEVGP